MGSPFSREPEKSKDKEGCEKDDENQRIFSSDNSLRDVLLSLGYTTLSDPINDRDSTELSYTADSFYKPATILGGRT